MPTTEAELITASLENAKLLLHQHNKVAKRTADRLIGRAGGAIDLENKQLLRALADVKRCTTDGWLAWEKKHALVIGLLEEEEPIDTDSPPAKQQKTAVPPAIVSPTTISRRAPPPVRSYFVGL